MAVTLHNSSGAVNGSIVVRKREMVVVWTRSLLHVVAAPRHPDTRLTVDRERYNLL